MEHLAGISYLFLLVLVFIDLSVVHLCGLILLQLFLIIFQSLSAFPDWFPNNKEVTTGGERYVGGAGQSRRSLPGSDLYPPS